MLPSRFDDISQAEILRLVEDKIAERKTLDYKQMLSIATGDERVEFLADVSSFANASGGDIIFGVSDARDESGKATGIPAEITPLAISNPSSECARIEQLIETGIQPRIPVVQIKALEIPDKGFVVVLRIGKSWIAPHMITYANRSRFYSRNSSTGKVQLDVQQIGAAFAMQRSLGERLRSWKADRIAKAIAQDGPIALRGSAALYHFISAAALIDENLAHPRAFERQKWGRAARLMSLSSESERYNADGYLMVSKAIHDSRAEAGQSYLQIFRDGSLEFGDSYALGSYGEFYVASQDFEEKVLKTFHRAMLLLRQLEAPEPVFVSLTLLGMKGRTMALPNNSTRWNQRSDPFDRDLIFTPDVLIQNLEEGYPYSTTLLPIVNAIWQAAGLESTPYSEHIIWRYNNQPD